MDKLTDLQYAIVVEKYEIAQSQKGNLETRRQKNGKKSQEVQIHINSSATKKKYFKRVKTWHRSIYNTHTNLSNLCQLMN